MRSRTWLGWAAPAALLGAPGAAAQPVSYDEALRIAVSGQPAVEARTRQVAGRRAEREAADQLPDPRLTAGIVNLPVTGPDALSPTAMTMLQVGVEQQIPNLAKRHARAGLAASAITAAEAELGVTERAVRVEAGLAWIGLDYAQRRLVLARQAEEAVGTLVPLARSALASGSARPAETLGVRRALLNLADARTAIAAELASAQARLVRYLGEGEPVAVGAAPSPLLDPDRLRSGLEQNPTLRLAAAQIGTADAAVRSAEAELRPDFGVSVSYGKRDSQFGDVASVMGSVTLPIFARRRQEPRIAAARANRSAARAEREERLRALISSFEADRAAWRSAVEQWQRARDELLPLAQERVALESASYAAGRASLVDVVSARTDLALLALDILAREGRAAAAAARLRLSYGEDAQ